MTKASGAEAVQAYLNTLTVELTKAVLRSRHLPLMHESDATLYWFLHQHFDTLAQQQAKEDAIAISSENAATLLHEVLFKELATVPQLKTKPQKISSSPSTTSQASAAVLVQQTCGSDIPSMAQRTLRERLSHHKINVTAFAEVVEVCRYLESQIGQHPGASKAAFGSVNLLHFVAVYLTLLPTTYEQKLFHLISLVVDSKSLDELTKKRIFYIWSVLDVVNRDALREVIDAMEQRPGLSVPMLVEFLPNVVHLGTNKGSSSNDATASLVPPSRQGRVARHDPDEVPAPPPTTNAVTTTTTASTADVESDDEEVERSAEDKAFWGAMLGC